MLGDQKSKKTLREVKQKEEVGVIRTFKFKAGTSPSWCQYFWGGAVGLVLSVRAEDWNPLQGSADADSKQARRVPSPPSRLHSNFFRYMGLVVEPNRKSPKEGKV